MRLDTALPREAALTEALLGTAVEPARPTAAPSLLRRAAEGGGDLLLLLGIVFCIPFIVLALGLPVALGVRLLLWLGGQF